MKVLIGTTNRTENAATAKTLEAGTYLLAADDTTICARGADGIGDYYAVYALIAALLENPSRAHQVTLSASDLKNVPVADTLKAMSFNVWVSSPTAERKLSVLQTILNYMPDTFGVQEASSTWMSYLINQLGDIYAHVGKSSKELLSFEVKLSGNNPQIILSRTHPGLVKKLFEQEVPECGDGVVEIKSISREAGSRSKISVYSQDENVDAVGACVGPRGSRVQVICDELNGEKIDIIKYSEDAAEFISAALSPSDVVSCDVDEETHSASVLVPAGQLSLAIGKEGQNARLAAKLTGWKIDIKPEA